MKETLIFGLIFLINILFLIKFRVKYSFTILLFITFVWDIFWLYREDGFNYKIHGISHIFYIMVLNFFIFFSLISTNFNIVQSLVRLIYFIVNKIKKLL